MTMGSMGTVGAIKSVVDLTLTVLTMKRIQEHTKKTLMLVDSLH